MRHVTLFTSRAAGSPHGFENGPKRGEAAGETEPVVASEGEGRYAAVGHRANRNNVDISLFRDTLAVRLALAVSHSDAKPFVAPL